MDIWKRALWRVPLVSLAAGILWTPCMVRLLVGFAITKLPDGTVEINQARSLLLEGGMMVLVLFWGGLLLLQSLPRREIFLSASLVVGYGALVVLAQKITGIVTGPGALVFMKLYAPLEWTHFPSSLLFHLFPGDGSPEYYGNLLFVLPSLAVPWLFTLFGKRPAAGSMEPDL